MYKNYAKNLMRIHSKISSDFYINYSMNESFKQYKTGMFVKGKISKVTDSYALANLDTVLCGIVHISKIGMKSVPSMHQMFKTGDICDFIIIRKLLT